MKKFNYLVFLGRFQPFHIGHIDVVLEALEIAQELIIIVGSLDKSPDIRNPLSSNVREHLIRETLGPKLMERVTIRHQHDHTYNESKWLSSIQNTVAGVITSKEGWRDKPPSVGLIGYDKDHTTFYLNKFPQWTTYFIENPVHKEINATRIRNSFYYFRGKNGCLDPKMFQNIEHLMRTKNALSEAATKFNIHEEWKFIQDYKKSWEAAPFSVNFVTTDAVVVQSGHLLVVERGGMPGQGQIALPGGHLKEHLTIRQNVIEELREETGLKVPSPVLQGSVVKEDVFDDPNRSTRGRTVTYATYFKLNDQEKLPRIKGADDAKAAWWIPVSEFQARRNETFEDHISIVENLMGI